MDLKISDLPLASAITGTEYAPVIQGGVTKKVLVSGFGSSQVSSTATIALLENNTNWTNNIYTGATALTAQGAGDFYINNTYDYKFYTTSGVLKARRILINSSAPPTSGFTYTFPLTLS